VCSETGWIFTYKDSLLTTAPFLDANFDRELRKQRERRGNLLAAKGRKRRIKESNGDEFFTADYADYADRERGGERHEFHEFARRGF
jgi:hypothetical protein